MGNKKKNIYQDKFASPDKKLWPKTQKDEDTPKYNSRSYFKWS